jgi:hypothetical protein
MPGLDDPESRTTAADIDRLLNASGPSAPLNAYEGEVPAELMADVLEEHAGPRRNVHTHVPASHMAYFSGYIQSIKALSEATARSRNSLCAALEQDLVAQKRQCAQVIISVPEAAAIDAALQHRLARLSPRQRRAYDQADAAVSQPTLDNPEWCQLIMFLSGQGGTGIHGHTLHTYYMTNPY